MFAFTLQALITEMTCSLNHQKSPQIGYNTYSVLLPSSSLEHGSTIVDILICSLTGQHAEASQVEQLVKAALNVFSVLLLYCSNHYVSFLLSFVIHLPGNCPTSARRSPLVVICALPDVILSFHTTGGLRMAAVPSVLLV